jgi:hypothetical protein
MLAVKVKPASPVASLALRELDGSALPRPLG